MSSLHMTASKVHAHANKGGSVDTALVAELKREADAAGVTYTGQNLNDAVAMLKGQKVPDDRADAVYKLGDAIQAFELQGLAASAGDPADPETDDSE